jgi:hypothetical protein
MSHIDNFEPSLDLSLIIATLSEASGTADFLTVSDKSGLSVISFANIVLLFPFVQLVGLLGVGPHTVDGLLFFLLTLLSEVLISILIDDYISESSIRWPDSLTFFLSCFSMGFLFSFLKILMLLVMSSI